MTDQNSGDDWFTVGWLGLGDDLYYKFTSCSHGIRTGLLIKEGKHDLKGGISFCKDCDGPTWELVEISPLTVTPSLHDPTTGWHGFITEGRWVPC